MESAESPLRYRYVVYAKILAVHKEPDGYYVHFDGSRESINLGDESPGVPGDEFKITFEKVNR